MAKHSSTWWFKSEKTPPLKKKFIGIDDSGKIDFMVREKKDYYRNSNFQQVHVKMWTKIPRIKNTLPRTLSGNIKRIFRRAKP